MTHWLTIYHERASNNFKLKKTNNWVDLLTRSGIKIGEKIDCWALYNAEKDPNGILRLLIEKVSENFVQNQINFENYIHQFYDTEIAVKVFL